MTKLFDLTGNLKIYMNERCRFTTDAVLLSDFASPKRSDRACDFCSGSGVIPLLWQDARKVAPKFSLCVEIDSEIASLLQQSIDYNQRGAVMAVRCADLSTISQKDVETFDLVTCNPPYFRENSGKIGQNDTARHQLLCDTETIVASASRVLKYGGRLAMCQRPERLTDILVAMRQEKIEPKRLRFCYHTEEKAPFLILVEGKKGGKSGLTVLPNLILEQNGQPTEEYMRIYKAFFNTNSEVQHV